MSIINKHQICNQNLALYEHTGIYIYIYIYIYIHEYKHTGIDINQQVDNE